ncbi:MAG: aminoglycoside phosphotransferase family protein [Desulfomonilaceae bacterium]
MSENKSISDAIIRVAAQFGEIRSFDPLAGDASTRKYFRLSFNDGATAIAMVLSNPGANEESTFLEIQNYLKNLQIPVPKIMAHDATVGILIIEDLGDDLLEMLAEQSDQKDLERLYLMAVDNIISLQKRSLETDLRCSAFELAFDETKLMWEMDFFLSHFVRGWAGRILSSVQLAQIKSCFRKICQELASEPRVLTHRDYHSRNLIFNNGRLYMIDFQDARMGPAQYDLASLLRDSYISLPEDLVEKLIGYFFERASYVADHDYGRFRRIFDIMALQRNIKALGTFGYQASVRGSSRYLSAIPRTATYISRTLRTYPEFNQHFSLLEENVLVPSLSFPSP